MEEWLEIKLFKGGGNFHDNKFVPSPSYCILKFFVYIEIKSPLESWFSLMIKN
jgi:hypothetical protein